MVKCNVSPQEFIKNAFTPQIGVICSPQAEISCRKNNLSFIELLQPFCRLGTEIQYRDPTGIQSPVRNFKITLVDVNFRPPQPTLAKKYLHSSVSQHTECRTETLEVGTYELNIPSFVPWYDAWRETFLQVQYPTDHEYTKHFLACMLVVSSADNNMIETLNQMVNSLNQMQSSTNNSQMKLPKWFNKNVLRYFVVIHENLTGDHVKIVETFDLLKVTYDSSHCFLLRLNSRSPNQDGEQLPDPWSQFLTGRIPQNTDNKASTPESSPNVSRVMTQSLESAEEIMESNTNMVYHPLSPDNNDLHTKDFLSDFDKPVSPPVLHGGSLSTEDVEMIKLLVHEFCTRALLPYLERQTHQLNDLILTRKGVSKSLLTATKRWFTPNKPSAATINTITYTVDSPEIQVRKLGDLYFMLGQYTLAYQAFHTAKRDFNADQAWLHYAAALEMAALAAFMANEPNRKTYDYMEESITTYLNTCKLPQFATRATIFSAECLKSRQLFGQAAHQLIRMTSEESDLRSALLLEQAAYCFLDCGETNASGANTGRTHLVRKYAFHMVLAGHRYSKAAQRVHSLRCYQQAQEIYSSQGWHLAEDHIYYTIGRQANSIGAYSRSLEFYARLLTGQSKQSPSQQEVFLREYLLIYKTYLQQQQPNLSLPQVLPLPLIDNEHIKILVGPATPLRTPGKVSAVGITFADEDNATLQKWTKLEEMLVQEAAMNAPVTVTTITAGSQSSSVAAPLVFQRAATTTLFSHANVTNTNPTAVLGEPIRVAVRLDNPLQILLHLSDLYLLWTFEELDAATVDGGIGRFVANEMTGDPHGGSSGVDQHRLVKTHVIRTVVLQAAEGHDVVLHVTPLCVGRLVLKGICYNITSTGKVPGIDSSLTIAGQSDGAIVLRGKRPFEINGPKIKRKEHMAADFRPDRRLTINVVPTAPCLQVSFNELNTELLRNEIQPVQIQFHNVGTIPVSNIHLATSLPHLLSTCDFSSPSPLSSSEIKQSSVNVAALENPAVREREARRNHVMRVPLTTSDNVIAPGQCHTVTLWLRAPDNVCGPVVVDLFIYYESVDRAILPRYRIVRHNWHLVIYESLRLYTNVLSSSSSTTSEKLTVTLKAQNQNMIHHAVSTDVVLHSVALLSDKWMLLQEVVSDKAGGKCVQPTKLQAQECAHIVLKAQRLVGRAAATDEYSEVRFHWERKSGDADDAVLEGMRRACLDFAQREEGTRVNIFDDLAKTIESMSKTRDATIILKWQALITDSCGKKRTVFGQNSMTINMIPTVGLSMPAELPSILVSPSINTPLPTPPSSLYTTITLADTSLDKLNLSSNNTSLFESQSPSQVLSSAIEKLVLSPMDVSMPQLVDTFDQGQLEQLKKQLNYNLVHAPRLRHDFAQSRLCVVPVVLYVHNLTDRPLSIAVHTIGTSSDTALMYQKPVLYNPYASNYFRWIREGSIVRALAPYASDRITLTVALLAAGTYDLGARLQVWCYGADQPNTAVLQSCRFHSSLIVAGIETSAHDENLVGVR